MEISYRQPRRRLMLILGLAYLAVLLTVAIINFDAAADLVNGLAAGGAKGMGMIVGLVCLLPIALLLALAMRSVVIRQDAATLTIRAGRTETHVARRDIARITVNTPRVCSIRLHAAGGELLAELEPRPREFPQVLELLTGDGSFVETERRSAFRGRVSVVTYEHRSAPAAPSFTAP